MRAIIMAAGDSPGTVPLNEHYPTPLLPLVDRPFLQYLVEFCAAQGVSRFDFVLCHLPEKIEHLLGDGKRWGCTFTFHLARDPLRPYRLLRALHFEGEDNQLLLLGHADRLPLLRLQEATTASAGTLPALFHWHDDTAPDAISQRRWTGWALLSPKQLATLPGDPDEKELEAHLLASASDPRSWVQVPRPLSVATFSDLLAAHESILTKAFPGPALTGKEVNPGIWLSRNVKLHPTAQLVPPAYIGENCGIGAGVLLGPGVVVGKDCVLDDHSKVSNAIIFPGSYVGQALELSDGIVDKNLLINVRLGGAVRITDNFIISSIHEGQVMAGVRRLSAQFAAAVLLLLALPVLLLTMLCLKLFRRGPVCYRKEVVYLPAPGEEHTWQSFRLLSFSPDSAAVVPCGFRALLLRFLPALVHVVTGHLCFVGVPPRSKDEIKRLPQDWQKLYLRGKAGIVTEAAVCHRPDPDQDELYAAEAFYVATASSKYDLKLLLRFLARSLFGFRRRPAVQSD